jgi:hypothetical protein
VEDGKRRQANIQVRGVSTGTRLIAIGEQHNYDF